MQEVDPRWTSEEFRTLLIFIDIEIARLTLVLDEMAAFMDEGDPLRPGVIESREWLACPKEHGGTLPVVFSHLMLRYILHNPDDERDLDLSKETIIAYASEHPL